MNKKYARLQAILDVIFSAEGMMALLFIGGFSFILILAMVLSKLFRIGVFCILIGMGVLVFPLVSSGRISKFIWERKLLLIALAVPAMLLVLYGAYLCKYNFPR